MKFIFIALIVSILSLPTTPLKAQLVICPNAGSGNVGCLNNGNNNNGNLNRGNNNTGSLNRGNNGLDNVGNGNNGNGNNGNNNTGNNNIGNNHVGNNNEDEWHLRFNRIIPLAFGNFDWLTKIVNLVETKSNDVLEYDVYGGGLLVTKEESVVLGAGLAATFDFPMAGDRYTLPTGMGVAVGLTPVANSKAVYKLKVSTLEDLKKRKLQIPFNVKTLKLMNADEEAFFELTGGLAASAGFTVYGATVGTSFVSMGGYEARVRKLEGSNVQVEIFRKNMKALGFAAGTIGVQALTSKIEARSKIFRFTFDVSDEKAAMAYEMALRGRVKDVQEMAKSSTSISLGAKGFTRMNGKKGGLRMALPLVPVLSLAWMTSKDQTLSALDDYDLETLTRTQYATYNKELSSRAFGYHSEKFETFTAATVVEENENGSKTVEIGGRFNLIDRTTRASSKRIERALERFKKRTNLVEVLNIKVPKQKELAYSSVELEVRWPESFVRHLMKLAINEQMDDVLLAHIEAQLKGNKNKNDLMKSYASEVLGLMKHAQEMRFQVGLNANEFAAAFRSIGKQTMTGPDEGILFRAFYEEAKKCGVEAKLTVEGQRISRMQKWARYVHTDACLKL